MSMVDGGNSSSSGEEDGNAEWLANINSISSPTFKSNGYILPTSKSNGHIIFENGSELLDDNYKQPQKLKHYQIKAQKLLDDILEKTIEVVKDPDELDTVPTSSWTGVRLFRDAPPGIVFDHREQLQGPTKKPRIIPGEEIDEKSKKFKRQLQSVAVDGADIIAAAKDRYTKLLAKLEAKDAVKKAAAKREEERVAELKKVRGERWLPSIAKDMRLNLQKR